MACLLYLTTAKIEDRSNHCHQTKWRCADWPKTCSTFFYELDNITFSLALLEQKKGETFNLIWFSEAITLSHFIPSKLIYCNFFRRRQLMSTRRIRLYFWFNDRIIIHQMSSTKLHENLIFFFVVNLFLIKIHFFYLLSNICIISLVYLMQLSA